jgi:glycosyltransferase involved in cell wall biosynthesis
MAELATRFGSDAKSKSSTKTVLMEFTARRHSLYNDLISLPPKGYSFVESRSSLDEVILSGVGPETLIGIGFRLGKGVVPGSVLKSLFTRFIELPDHDLAYSSGHLVMRNEPWVCDLEVATHFTDYSTRLLNAYRSFIEKRLSSPHCKGILPWTNAAQISLERSLDCSGFIDKVVTIPIAVRPKSFRKDYSNEGTRILFVGSINFSGDFYMKGGHEVIQSYIRLKDHHKDASLTVRANVPDEIMQRYRSVPGITFIREKISTARLEEEFKNADIFAFPSHHTPGRVLLDAMSYELPVVVSDLWANPEMVTHGENGFLIECSKKIRYVDDRNIPLWGQRGFETRIRTPDPKVVQDLTDALDILIQDRSLRRKMGARGRALVENGRHSIASRNASLKKVLDSALC